MVLSNIGGATVSVTSCRGPSITTGGALHVAWLAGRTLGGLGGLLDAICLPVAIAVALRQTHVSSEEQDCDCQKQAHHRQYFAFAHRSSPPKVLPNRPGADRACASQTESCVSFFPEPAFPPFPGLCSSSCGNAVFHVERTNLRPVAVRLEIGVFGRYRPFVFKVLGYCAKESMKQAHHFSGASALIR
jgi:hypothetical protein